MLARFFASLVTTSLRGRAAGPAAGAGLAVAAALAFGSGCSTEPAGPQDRSGQADSGAAVHVPQTRGVNPPGGKRPAANPQGAGPPGPDSQARAPLRPASPGAGRGASAQPADGRREGPDARHEHPNRRTVDASRVLDRIALRIGGGPVLRDTPAVNDLRAE
jgi:hypothetical protein